MTDIEVVQAGARRKPWQLAAIIGVPLLLLGGLVAVFAATGDSSRSALAGDVVDTFDTTETTEATTTDVATTVEVVAPGTDSVPADTRDPLSPDTGGGVTYDEFVAALKIGNQAIIDAYCSANPPPTVTVPNFVGRTYSSGLGTFTPAERVAYVTATGCEFPSAGQLMATSNLILEATYVCNADPSFESVILSQVDPPGSPYTLIGSRLRISVYQWCPEETTSSSSSQPPLETTTTWVPEG